VVTLSTMASTMEVTVVAIGFGDAGNLAVIAV
jgi:hypothetical protein